MLFVLSLYLLVFSLTLVDSQNKVCADVSNDCRLIAVKCLSPNRIEQKLMEVACPLTCGYCIEAKVTLTTADTRIVPAKCVDEADDCADRANFCQRKFYRRMMSLQCAKTCKFCDSDEEYEEEEAAVEDSRELHVFNLKSKLGEEAVQKLESLNMVDNVIELVKNSTSSPPGKGRFSKNLVVSSMELPDPDECVDRTTDCERNRQLCTHKAYSSLFRKICARTCEYCGLADSTNESSGEIF